jgi:hypothetical protein
MNKKKILVISAFSTFLILFIIALVILIPKRWSSLNSSDDLNKNTHNSGSSESPILGNLNRNNNISESSIILTPDSAVNVSGNVNKNNEISERPIPDPSLGNSDNLKNTHISESTQTPNPNPALGGSDNLSRNKIISESSETRIPYPLNGSGNLNNRDSSEAAVSDPALGGSDSLNKNNDNPESPKTLTDSTLNGTGYVNKNNDNLDRSETPISDPPLNSSDNLNKNKDIPESSKTLTPFPTPNINNEDPKVKEEAPNRLMGLLNTLGNSYPLFPISSRVLLRDLLFDDSQAKPPFFQYRYLTLFYSNDLKMLLDLSKLSQSDLDGHPSEVLKIFDSCVKAVLDHDDSNLTNTECSPTDRFVQTENIYALYKISLDFQGYRAQTRIRETLSEFEKVLKYQREYLEYLQNPPPKKIYSTLQEMTGQLEKFSISSSDIIQFMNFLSTLPQETLRPIFQGNGKYVVFYFLADSQMKQILNTPDDSFLLIKDLWEEIGILLKKFFENEQVKDSELLKELTRLNEQLKSATYRSKYRPVSDILKLFEGFICVNLRGIDIKEFREQVSQRIAKLNFARVINQFDLIEDCDKPELIRCQLDDIVTGQGIENVGIDKYFAAILAGDIPHSEHSTLAFEFLFGQFIKQRRFKLISKLLLDETATLDDFELTVLYTGLEDIFSVIYVTCYFWDILQLDHQVRLNTWKKYLCQTLSDKFYTLTPTPLHCLNNLLSFCRDDFDKKPQLLNIGQVLL